MDHFSHSVGLIEDVQRKRQILLAAYAADAYDRGAVAQLHQDIGVGLKLADVHATLALCQRLDQGALAR